MTAHKTVKAIFFASIILGIVVIGLLPGYSRAMEEDAAILCSSTGFSTQEADYLVMRTESLKNLPTDNSNDITLIQPRFLEPKDAVTRLFEEQQLLPPLNCWDIDLATLAAIYPGLAEIISEFQERSSGSRLPEYEIIHLNEAMTSGAIKVRVGSSLLLGSLALGILYALAVNSYLSFNTALIGALISTFSCLVWNDQCLGLMNTYLYPIVAPFLSNQASQSQDTNRHRDNYQGWGTMTRTADNFNNEDLKRIDFGGNMHKFKYNND